MYEIRHEGLEGFFLCVGLFRALLLFYGAETGEESAKAVEVCGKEGLNILPEHHGSAQTADVDVVDPYAHTSAAKRRPMLARHFSGGYRNGKRESREATIELSPPKLHT
jgi:hypothetical protein